MRRELIAILSLGLSSILAPAVARAAPPGFTTLEIGATAPDFSLPGVDGKDHSLAGFAGAKLLCVIFTCNHCPTAQAYEDRIIKLHADFKDRGVALVAISPNDDKAIRLDELGYTDVGDSFADMQRRAKDRDFKFPYLYDGETQRVSLAYGVLATPQVFLFDERRKLRYVGRIDDSDVKTVTSHDLRNALDALLTGKPVPAEKTRTFGCSTKWSEKRADARASLDKWDQESATLESLDEKSLVKLVRNETDNYVLVNVWASWCGPCVTEMPELVTMHRMYRKRNFQLVTISIDEPEQKASALRILQENHASAVNYLSAIEKKDRLADLLDKDWQGALPYTLLIAPGGKIVCRKNGPVDALELRAAVANALGRTYASRSDKK